MSEGAVEPETFILIGGAQNFRIAGNHFTAPPVGKPGRYPDNLSCFIFDATNVDGLIGPNTHLVYKEGELDEGDPCRRRASARDSQIPHRL
jgi:hypothetical protein